MPNPTQQYAGDLKIDDAQSYLVTVDATGATSFTLLMLYQEPYTGYTSQAVIAARNHFIQQGKVTGSPLSFLAFVIDADPNGVGSQQPVLVITQDLR